MTRAADWYDSNWLNAYHAALRVVAEVAPGRLAEFVNSFDILRTDPAFTTRHLPDLIGADELAEIRAIVRAVPMASLEMHEVKAFGRFVVHDIPAFTAIQASLVDRVSQWGGEPLEPSYNFLSLYTRLGECKPHLDSPSAKWTLDLCIDQSAIWPIHLSKTLSWPDADEDTLTAIDEFATYLLEPGDAIFFSGSSQWHYRDAMPRAPGKQFCDLLFMHFIPRGAAELIRPANWSRLFGIPELALIPRIDEAL